MIGANDLFIAAHARTLGLRLVTNNAVEFGRVKGLTIENWSSPLVAVAREAMNSARTWSSIRLTARFMPRMP
jgi:hypothetical protein